MMSDALVYGTGNPVDQTNPGMHQFPYSDVLPSDKV
jgi:hypothetical protein